MSGAPGFKKFGDVVNTLERIRKQNTEKDTNNYSARKHGFFMFLTKTDIFGNKKS